MIDSRKMFLPPEADGWLAEHPDVNRTDLEHVWKLSELADDPFKPDDKRVAEMRETIVCAMAAPSSSRLRLMLRQPGLRIAASVVLLIAVGALLWLRPIEKSASAGETASVTLPDGSLVLLNSESTIAYRRTFGWVRRSVTLQGEAFFDVKKSDSEFEVSTFNGSVTVLGTRFNVRSWSDDARPETAVHVEEGVVRLAAGAVYEEPVLIRAGNWSSIERRLPPRQPVATTIRTEPVWQDGGMAFSDRSLGDVLSDIRRRFDVAVTVRPDSMLDASVSLYLASAVDIGTVLEMVAGAHDLQVVKTKDGFELAAQ